MAVYFTADTHFGHAGVIKACHRPFGCVAEMDAALISNWNEVVGPDDTVYHLGDFCFKGSKLAQKVLEQLSGEIIFIVGNHDTENTVKLARWAATHDMLEISVDGAKLILCHYPFLEWVGVYRGARHLHGHTHARIPPTSLRADVGVDAWNYRPVSWPEIRARMSEAAPHDPEAFYAPRAVRAPGPDR